MIREFFNLLFPPVCLGCQQMLTGGEVLICTHCRGNLPIADFHTRPDNMLMQRLTGTVKVEGISAYLKYYKSGLTANLLHALKYKNHPELGKLMGKWFAYSLIKSGYFPEIQYIVPVPLHPAKLRKRGYNQSEYIAAGMSQVSHVPVGRILVRRKKGVSQALQKGREERWQNVNGLYGLSRPFPVDDGRVLLVDDVLTTGATLEACGQVLISAGCSQIHFATLAVSL